MAEDKTYTVTDAQLKCFGEFDPEVCLKGQPCSINEPCKRATIDRPKDRREMLRVHDRIYEICAEAELSPGMLYGVLFSVLGDIFESCIMPRATMEDD